MTKGGARKPSLKVQKKVSPQFKELCRRDPAFFRNNLVFEDPKSNTSPPTLVKWEELMAPLQIRIFKVIDEQLRWFAFGGPRPKYTMCFDQRSRGYSKSTDYGSNHLWWLFAAGTTPNSKRKVGFVCAEDRDQSLFVKQMMVEILDMNPWLLLENGGPIDVQKNVIINQMTGSKLEFVTSDANSSFGSTADIVHLDEFTHIKNETFIESVVSTFAKRDKILWVSCNAGSDRGGHWRIKQTAMESHQEGKQLKRKANNDDRFWYHSAPRGYAPWYNKKTIAMQKKVMSENGFRRLWLNEWLAGGEEFVTEEEARSCVKPHLVRREEAAFSGAQYFAVADFGRKHDRTVGTVGHYYQKGNEPGKIVLDRMDVIAPETQEGGIISPNYLKEWMREIQASFGSYEAPVYFVLDPHQLLGVIDDLKDEGFTIEEFQFQGGKGSWELSHYLKQCILDERLEWYEGCGEMFTPDGQLYQPDGGEDDLVVELARLKVRNTAGGKWRIDHEKSSFDDRSFTVGALCRTIILELADEDIDFGVSKPQGRTITI